MRLWTQEKVSDQERNLFATSTLDDTHLLVAVLKQEAITLAATSESEDSCPEVLAESLFPPHHQKQQLKKERFLTGRDFQLTTQTEQKP